MSREFSPDGRFLIESVERSDDSYMYSYSSYYWAVYVSETGQRIGEFHGRWDHDASRDHREGVKSVSFSPDGRELVIEYFDERVERRLLPYPGPDSRAAERVRVWQQFQERKDVKSAVVDFAKPVTLFRRKIGLQITIPQDYGIPGGGGVAHGTQVTLRLSGGYCTIAPDFRIVDCFGLRIAVKPEEGGKGFRVFVAKIAPAAGPGRKKRKRGSPG